MANNFDSNFTRQLARVFLEKFDSERVLSKNVNTQLLQGRFNPASGENVDFKRPTDYKSVRTPTGDLTNEDASDIITGKATGTVQNYFTAFVDYDEADEAIKMDQLDQLLAPLATRIKTDLELDFAKFMLKNTALLSGTVGTAVTTWDHVADAGATMQANGVPMDSEWMYAVNPFTQTTLASDQRSLGAGGSAGGLISDAHRRAIISDNFAGLKVMTATTLGSYTTDADADRVGTLLATPDVTYVTAKDTMTQVLSLTGFGATLTIKAGETLTVGAATGDINRLNLSTREVIVDATGAQIVWTGTVQADVTLVAGAGLITVSGPMIFETAAGVGQYNTFTQPPLSGDAVTLSISSATAVVVQPNLFWHKEAFAIGSEPIKKLQSVDTIATTEDGLQFRVSKGSDFIKNQQKVRFDFRPAYAVLNPFFAGQGFG